MVNVDCFFMFVQMKKFMRGIRIAADTAHRTPDIEYRVSPSIRVIYILRLQIEIDEDYTLILFFPFILVDPLSLKGFKDVSLKLSAENECSFSEKEES
jgi:hypothetical protein